MPSKICLYAGSSHSLLTFNVLLRPKLHKNCVLRTDMMFFRQMSGAYTSRGTTEISVVKGSALDLISKNLFFIPWTSSFTLSTSFQHLIYPLKFLFYIPFHSFNMSFNIFSYIVNLCFNTFHLRLNLLLNTFHDRFYFQLSAIYGQSSFLFCLLGFHFFLPGFHLFFLISFILAAMSVFSKIGLHSFI